ncbi:ABC transporter permease [Thermophilibacter immobilis]|uniref:Iron ABC transporter permease n=1 Tax=Thermophilibacter immobilis TaxID=2779519 RepID=A0A7S7M7K3_9ACTN|nr:iron ABC transporter permease [Thermophilibacter immobilis]QOY60220.1 iron ABC transporter permease [Thermophilibacter immobilis]
MRGLGVRGRLLDAALLGTVVVCCAVFIVWPIVCIVAQGLVPSEGLAGVWGVLSSSAGLLANSAFVGVLSAVLSTVVGLAVALVITFGSRPWSSVTSGLVAVSMISPPFVASLAYIELFGRRGLITHGLLGLSISPYGWWGVVLMQSLFFAAINVMLITSVLGRVDRSAVQAALDLGAPMGHVFLDVIMPLLRPALSVCLLLTFVRSISDYGTPVVIGGSFETIATEIYVRVVGYVDLRAAAVLNGLLFVVSGVVFVFFRRFDARDGAAGSKTLDAGVRPRAGEAGFALKGPLGVCAHLVCALFSGFLVVLYLTIVHSAFTKGMGWSAPFTLDQLTHLVKFDLGALWHSGVYALAAAAISTALGALVAYYAHRRRALFSLLLDFVATVPYTLPGICLGLGYILAFNAAPLELVGTDVIIVAVLAAKQLTISSRAFSSALAQVPVELDLAARDLGASDPQVLGDVLLPNLLPAVGVSLVNGFSSAMVSYSAVLFLITPGHKTAVFQLFDALSGGKYGDAAMISLALIVVTTLVNVIFYQLLLGRRRSRVSGTLGAL